MARRRTRVLVADDEPMMRRLLQRLLDSHEHATIVGEAADGNETLQLWRELDPDVIVLDQMMPGMTGLEVAEVILSEKPSQHIILFTAVAQGSIADDAEQLGIAHCVPKADVSAILDLLDRPLDP